MLIKFKMWIARMCQYLLYFLIPVKNNRIMLYAHLRKGYVCNPKAIMDYLLRYEPGKYELIWITSYPESCEPMEGVKVVGMRSFSYFLSFIRTKFFITNDMVDENLIKKRNQVFINTWHGGGAYKKVGLDTINESAELAKNFKKWYQRTDYFISSCAKCTFFYAKAFGISQEKFLEIGMPRNDIFFEEHQEIEEKVRQFYHLTKETSILIFAPSFQKHSSQNKEGMYAALEKVVAQLKESTGNDWVALCRDHYFEQTNLEPYSDKIRNGNSYYDIQELLYSADILVTDFSSCIWDFALTGRPVFLLEENLVEYEKRDRGFFTHYTTWPYVGINKLDEILQITKEDFSDKINTAYDKHYFEMGSFERGTACKEFANLLKS